MRPLYFGYVCGRSEVDGNDGNHLRMMFQVGGSRFPRSVVCQAQLAPAVLGRRHSAIYPGWYLLA